jgi:hypothetical protein
MQCFKHINDKKNTNSKNNLLKNTITFFDEVTSGSAQNMIKQLFYFNGYILQKLKKKL